MAGEVAFMPTETDVVAATRDWARRDLARPRQLWATLAAGAAAACLALIFALKPEAPPERVVPIALGAGLGAILLVVLILAIRFAALPAQARRTFRQNKAVQKEQLYCWSDEGIGWRSASSDSRIAWAELYRWSEGRHAFLFAVSERGVHFVPRRALSDAEAADLRATAERFGPPLF
ncbi:MAG: YcxB family protein [Sphingomonadaceae bacterium]|nr:YcxB family protein [Sphingomonadaceae bacterium]